MNKSFEAVDINIQNDIKHASNKKINEIYNELKQALKLFDKDPFFKNAKDYFKRLFADKRRACLLFLNDLYDSKDKLTDEQRELTFDTFVVGTFNREASQASLLIAANP